MKFALVVPEEFHRHYHQHPFEISGLLNWARVLGGDVRMINEDLGKYDVLMTNVSSTETEYISIIRQVNPDATIIACFDYGFDIIGQYFADLGRVKQVMSRADLVFSVNRNQAEWMSLILPDQAIRYIPHPSDTDAIRKYRRKPEERSGGIAAMWHQYDNYHIQSLEVLRAVERKLGARFHKTLIGLKIPIMLREGIHIPSAGYPVVADDHPDPDARGRPLDPDLPKVIQSAPPGMAWDSVMPYMGVQMWYDVMGHYNAALDLYTVNSMGRFGIDCAALGIPLVASERQDSSQLLYPFSTVDPHSPEKAIRLMAKMVSNRTFYDRVEDTAERNVDHYGFDRSRTRMMRALEPFL